MVCLNVLENIIIITIINIIIIVIIFITNFVVPTVLLDRYSMFACFGKAHRLINQNVCNVPGCLLFAMILFGPPSGLDWTFLFFVYQNCQPSQFGYYKEDI